VEELGAVDGETRVPEQVGGERPEPCPGGEGRFEQGQLEVAEQPAQVAGGARPRLRERGRVDAYANRRYPSRKIVPVRSQEN